MARTPVLVQNIVTGILVICAAAIAVVAVHREFFPQKQANSIVSRKIHNWKTLLNGKHVILGSPDAPLKIVEFSDYQCPYCRDLDPKLIALVHRNPKEISLIRYNLPLGSIHEYAYKAAIAAECAAQQDVYEPFQAALFKVDLAKADWVNLAHSAHVTDTKEFISCLHDRKTASLVDSDLKVATELGIDATPTLVINGNVVYGTRTTKELQALLNTF